LRAGKVGVGEYALEVVVQQRARIRDPRGRCDGDRTVEGAPGHGASTGEADKQWKSIQSFHNPLLNHNEGADFTASVLFSTSQAKSRAGRRAIIFLGWQRAIAPQW
jgi:hypothetical protein